MKAPKPAKTQIQSIGVCSMAYLYRMVRSARVKKVNTAVRSAAGQGGTGQCCMLTWTTGCAAFLRSCDWLELGSSAYVKGITWSPCSASSHLIGRLNATWQTGIPCTADENRSKHRGEVSDTCNKALLSRAPFARLLDQNHDKGSKIWIKI